MSEAMQECVINEIDKEEVETLICNYYWREAEIHRLNMEIIRSGGFTGGGSKMTQVYGWEATMPKKIGGLSQAEFDELDRREQRLLKKIDKQQSIMAFVEIGEELVEGTLHEVVYSCMMDGMSYREIAKHLKTNREKIRILRDELLSQLCQNSHFCQNWHYLKHHKQAV